MFDIEKGKPTVRLATLAAVLHALNIALGIDSPLMGEFIATLSDTGEQGQ